MPILDGVLLYLVTPPCSAGHTVLYLCQILRVDDWVAAMRYFTPP